MTAIPEQHRQLQSLITADGQLVLTLATVPVPQPGDDEVLVQMQATPINPSDLGLMLATADPATLQAGQANGQPTLSGPIPPATLKGFSGRIGTPMPVGNEGAGVVVAAGRGSAAQALLGKTVAILGGGMYAQYRCLPAHQCLPLAEGTTAAEGASAFVNPLTALGMVETMRREGHTALVHTAAASNLGQMLNRICQKDGIELVNIVRKPEQAALLREQGARHVCDSSAPSFLDDLTKALAETGATIAFDATGGGNLASQILKCMEEAVAIRQPAAYNRYGSNVLKQVYLYGNLDTRPTEIVRNFGFSWRLGGWLLTPFLQQIGLEATQALKQRVANEIKTTFASRYAQRITLQQMIEPEIVRAYAKRATGQKYLVEPHLG